MLSLLLGHRFLFLLFLLGYLFLLRNLFFRFRNNLLFFSEAHRPVAGRARVHPPTSSGSAALPPGSFVHPDELKDQRVYI